MAAPLSICTKDEQRNEVRFIWAGRVKGVEILKRLCAQYEDKVFPHWSLYEWIETFKNGRTSATDAERSGRPSTSTNNDKHEQTGAMILDDKIITMTDIATRLDISQSFCPCNRA
jgi:hypothetical protein